MAPIRLHDTRSGELRELIPGADGRVGIYACGPTVYARIHVGNARPFVVNSLLKRFLEHEGHAVTLVINITDVNDKIYDAARARDVPSADLAAEMSAALRRRHRRAGPRTARHRAAGLRDDRADRLADRRPHRARPRLRRRRRRLLPRALRRRVRLAEPPRDRRDEPGRGGESRAPSARRIRWTSRCGRRTRTARTRSGSRPGAAAGRAGTSSARRWPRSSSASAFRSTAAATTSSSRTTRTRPRRRGWRATASSRRSGCTTGCCSSARRRWPRASATSWRCTTCSTTSGATR